MIDAASQKNLELVKNNQDGTRANTLFGILDFAATPMGSRLIKKWILRPLIKKELIEQRLDALETMTKDSLAINDLQNVLKQIGDLERVIGRIALKRATIRDYLSLSYSIENIPQILDILIKFESNLVLSLTQKISDFSSLENYLNFALNDNSELDQIIKTGFDQDLDKLRQLVDNGSQTIAQLELQEQQKTGIQSLKIRFNPAHGFAIEITKPNLHLVPDHYIRLQTLISKERYTTVELKELEQDIIKARTEIQFVEKEVFEKVKLEVESYLNQLKKLSYAISNIDAILGLAQTAIIYGYIRPKFNDKNEINITEGRHPIISARLEHEFVSNSLNLTQDESLWIITGPNMGGKSTFLRQSALTCIMAQIGSFIPAKYADLPILDRIFTRIGSGDNLADGKSTFLVEMEETALICNLATKNSLVILDEVGRGTSTYDGMAIAQAVLEYINEIGAKCLFATHYHELTQLTNKFPTIAAYHTASSKTETGILLLHKILKGVAPGSFGIEVAKVAKLPEKLILRAQEILKTLI